MSEQTASDEQTNAYRQTLVQLRDQLMEEIRALSGASLVSPHEAGQELADVGSDNFTQEVEINLMTAEADRLRSVNAALERLSQGTYGICVDCDKPIREVRLKALPFAQLCISCKEAREQEEGRLG